MFRLFSTAASLVACLLIALALSVQGQGGEPPPSKPAKGDSAADLDLGLSLSAPSMLRDPIFDRHVDMEELKAAVQNQDAALLLDVAIQLAEAEKLYARQHRSGIRADQLFGVAMRLALAKHDEAILKRMTVVMETRKDEAGTALLRQIKALAQPNRADPLPGLLAKLPKQKRTKIELFVSNVRDAVVTHDSDALATLTKELDKLPDVPADVTDLLKQRLEEARDQVHDTANATEVALQKLGGASRAGEKDVSTRIRLGGHPKDFGDPDNQKTYVTYIMRIEPANFDWETADKWARKGEEKCKNDGRCLYDVTRNSTILERSTKKIWCIMGCASTDGTFRRWIAGNYGPNLGYESNHAYMDSDDDAHEIRATDDTWHKRSFRDDDTGAQFGCGIGIDGGRIDGYFSGPR